MRSKRIYTKPFIIGLIKDDLLNTRLVSGLDSLGLESGCYYLRLHEKIFMLMGIEDNEELELRYLRECEAVQDLEVLHHPERLDELAVRLYNMLLKNSNTQKRNI